MLASMGIHRKSVGLMQTMENNRPNHTSHPLASGVAAAGYVISTQQYPRHTTLQDSSFTLSQ